MNQQCESSHPLRAASVQGILRKIAGAGRPQWPRRYASSRVFLASIVVFFGVGCHSALALNTSLARINGDDVHTLGHIGLTADVAIIDSGVGILNNQGDNHPSLVSGPTTITRKDFSGSVTANDDSKTAGGHGTHVAGIVASNNGTFRGVAPAADILGAKVFPSAGGGAPKNVTLNAMEWALGQGADVMNISLGSTQATSNGTDAQLQKYIDFLIDNPTRGTNNDTMNELVTVAIAAGNGTPLFPVGGVLVAGKIATTSITSNGSAYNGITVGVSTNNFLQATNWSSRRGIMSKGVDGQWGNAGVDDDGDGTIDNISDFGAPLSDDTFADSTTLRSKPDLIAPGSNIMSTNNDWGQSDTGSFTRTRLEGNNDGINTDGDDDSFDFVQKTGTSMSAPHVSGAAAVLFDIGNTTGGLLETGTPNGAQMDHKVIKSVLMTGTDKMGTDPSAVGVTRDDTVTPVNPLGAVWSSVSPSQPLDRTLGAGQLDLLNAVNLYLGGEDNPTNISSNAVDAMGWDIQAITTAVEPGRQLYTFAEKLVKGSWLTATLVWDRHVNWTDDGDGVVDFDDTFAYSALDDLDLGLYGGKHDALGALLHRSQSSIDNVEHLQFQIPATDFYTLDVQLLVGNGENYGLSWATTFIPEPATWLSMLLGVACFRLYGRSSKSFWT